MKESNVVVFPLGTLVQDSATGLKGMLTHVYIAGDKSERYLLQPHGLNPEDGQPVKRVWITPDRIISPKERVSVLLPVDVLGTVVEDTASGFSGTAVSLAVHISGCVHVEVQPGGRVTKTGAPVETADFDIRRLKGEALRPMSSQEREKDQKAKPSPSPVPRCVR